MRRIHQEEVKTEQKLSEKIRATKQLQVEQIESIKNKWRNSTNKEDQQQLSFSREKITTTCHKVKSATIDNRSNISECQRENFINDNKFEATEHSQQARKQNRNVELGQS